MSNYGNNNNPYVHLSPLPTSSTSTNRPNLCDELNRCSKKVEEATRRAEIMADNFWNHRQTLANLAKSNAVKTSANVRVSSSFADAAVARIVQGTKVLALGGPDMLFQQAFGIFPEEKLIKSFACYLSTSSGPVIGTLYVSTKRLAFCSDYALSHYPFSPQQNQRVHYKVIVQLDQLSTVNPSSNRFNPTEKYIQLVTEDGYEFYFMGFIAYDKALKTIREALQHYHNHSRESLHGQEA